MKKIFSLLLVMVFSAAVLPLNVLGASAEGSALSQQLKALPLEGVVDYVRTHDIEYGTLKNALLEREWASYEGDKEFARHYAEDLASAMEMIYRNVENQLALIQEETGVSPKTGNSTNAWIDSILFEQKLFAAAVNNIADRIRSFDCNRNSDYNGTRSIPTSEQYLISASLD